MVYLAAGRGRMTDSLAEWRPYGSLIARKLWLWESIRLMVWDWRRRCIVAIETPQSDKKVQWWIFLRKPSRRCRTGAPCPRIATLPLPRDRLRSTSRSFWTGASWKYQNFLDCQNSHKNLIIWRECTFTLILNPHKSVISEIKSILDCVKAAQNSTILSG